VLEAQRAGEIGERALDCWRGGGQLQRRCWRGGGPLAAALERGRPAAALERGRHGAQKGLERRQAAESQELERCQAAVFGRVLGFLLGLGLAWATQGTKSTDLVSQVDD
jgi:hypothetical protein